MYYTHMGLHMGLHGYGSISVPQSLDGLCFGPATAMIWRWWNASQLGSGWTRMHTVHIYIQPVSMKVYIYIWSYMYHWLDISEHFHMYPIDVSNMICIWVFKITYYIVIYSWNVVWLLANWCFHWQRWCPKQNNKWRVSYRIGDNHQFTLSFPNSKYTIHMDDNFG